MASGKPLRRNGFMLVVPDSLLPPSMHRRQEVVFPVVVDEPDPDRGAATEHDPQRERQPWDAAQAELAQRHVDKGAGRRARGVRLRAERHVAPAHQVTNDTAEANGHAGDDADHGVEPARDGGGGGSDARGAQRHRVEHVVQLGAVVLELHHPLQLLQPERAVAVGVEDVEERLGRRRRRRVWRQRRRRRLVQLLVAARHDELRFRHGLTRRDAQSRKEVPALIPDGKGGGGVVKLQQPLLRFDPTDLWPRDESDQRRE
mmetsp:Transcript_26851/g.58997  ORF Transcript_26851/g.58997 Transcript_26851/m.58997 type:complete len:259 (-) Transcript_26851:774-1550(-)